MLPSEPLALGLDPPCPVCGGRWRQGRVISRNGAATGRALFACAKRHEWTATREKGAARWTNDVKGTPNAPAE